MGDTTKRQQEPINVCDVLTSRQREKISHMHLNLDGLVDSLAYDYEGVLRSFGEDLSERNCNVVINVNLLTGEAIVDLTQLEKALRTRNTRGSEVKP